MQRPITRGASANSGLIFHVFAQDSTATDGSGKASIAYGSWSCRYIRNGEAISGAITPQDITTIGTYAAPTANTNIRIKAVDNTNMIGIYEVQIHADWVNTTNSCQSLTIYLTASGVAVLPIQIPLIGINQQSTTQEANVTQWLSSAAATPTVAGVPEVDVTHWIGTAAATPTVAGVPEVDVTHLGGGAQSATDLKDFADDGYDPSTNKVQGVVLVDTLTTYTGNTPQTGDAYAKVDTEIATIISDIATLAAYVDTEVAAIKVKTDNLPADPADASDIAASLATITGYIDTEIAAILAAVDTEIAAIKAKTDNLPTDPADASDIATATSAIAGYIDTEVAAILAAVDTEVAAILEDTGTTIPAQIAALNNLSAAQVNAEVVDALATDTYAEPAQGTPSATDALATKINHLYKALINPKTQTATTKKIYNNAGTVVDHKCTVTDDGTTYSETVMTTGP